MELDQPREPFEPVVDRRPVMPEPLPVRLVAVADVSGDAVAGLEGAMDGFYAAMLGFARASTPASEVGGSSVLVYHADNADLRFAVREPPLARDDLRPIAIEVPSLVEVRQKLIDREIEHTVQKSVTPGQESLLLQDPSGNWVELTERRGVR